MPVETYDIIIAGGGAAGLSLAYHLVHSSLGQRSILIVDKGAKNSNDRTWGFWTNQAMPFDQIVYREWSRLHLADDGGDTTLDMGDYRYKMIRGIDFYQFMRAELAQHPNVTFLQGVVERIEDGVEQAYVHVDGQIFAADLVFDSIFKPVALKHIDEHYHCLKLYFKGWEIETPSAAFDPAAVTLMDFRTPQCAETRFFYVLPFAENRALVEFTAFASGHCSQQAYEQALRDYLKTTLGISDYRILAEENGVIPATDFAFPRRVGQRVMTIGTPAGLVKPTTGYAFVRIQEDSAAIVQSLLVHEHPFDIPHHARRYRQLDAIMLEVMQNHGDQLAGVFATLFRRNPTRRIFRFLDETASLWENLLLVSSMPPWLFLKTVVQMKVVPLLDIKIPAMLSRRGSWG